LMLRRKLQASPEGIKKIRAMLKKKEWTQADLAGFVGCSRQTIASLFKGNRINGDYFREICSQLKLEQNEIVKDELIEENQQSKINIDVLVQEVRQKIKPLIQEQCGRMRVLDMTQPIGLNDIYTNVNILEKITGRRRKGISELLEESNFGDFDRFGLGEIKEKRVPGLEAVEKYSKLMILGKPGAGKTTFLKYLAIQSIEGKIKTELVPIFITLKDFAEVTNKPILLEYVSQQLANCEVTDNQVVEIFQNNKALVLLDGLDEVKEEDSQRVLKEIRDFSDQFLNNHFVMTCRIAAKEYIFDKFSEVEVADFDDEQIATFAKNWFKNKNVNADKFIKRLLCNHRVKELSTNPLLLTLLCLVFEESGEFPENRSELYKEGIDALLKKWDAKRGIYRDQVYKKLSAQRKEDLLSKIALNTFERSDYFFKQKVAEQYIREYIRNLPDAKTDPEALQFDSERVLKSIEAQHGLLVERAKGIYSFSHLTFHEYFTAREFVFVKQSSEKALYSLVNHLTNEQWREVFLLTVEMLADTDCLLLFMKEKIDSFLANYQELQQFLIWLNEKSRLVNIPCKPAAIRAFYSYWGYTNLDFWDGMPVTNPLADALDINYNDETELDYCLDASLGLGAYGLLYPESSYNNRGYIFLKKDFDMAITIASSLDPELYLSLQSLKLELTEIENSIEGYLLYVGWCSSRVYGGLLWGERLTSLMIKHRNIGHTWNFSKYKDLLEDYYYANLLLVDCLKSDCRVNPKVRQYIEDTLLLPISEIEKYPKPNL
ncbi:MAG: NACHT domain-containing NTPase, partial [Phormidium sp.]